MGYSFVDLARQRVLDSIQAKQRLLDSREVIEQMASLSQKCRDVLLNGGRIILAGNGGSFADAQHIAAEFTGRFIKERSALAAITLGTNASAVSAIGNDYGFEQIFARELSAIGLAKDVFIPISTSGNSPNILAAIDVAQKIGMPIVGLTGQSGGKMAQTCSCICVPSADTPRIQECHILIGHIICEWVDIE